MNKTLDQLLSLAGNQAHLVLLGLKLPELVPSWVFVQPDGSSKVLGTPWKDEAEKHSTVAYVRAWMRNHGTVAYSLMVEAWKAQLDPGEWDPNSKEPLPEALHARNRVDRIEVVIAFATDGKEIQYKEWQIVCDWQGKVAGLAPLEPEESDYERTGWLAELLSKSP
jgi:hypothetical protein